MSRDHFGLPEELQRDPDPEPRRGLLWRVLLIVAALLGLIAWVPLP